MGARRSDAPSSMTYGKSSWRHSSTSQPPPQSKRKNDNAQQTEGSGTNEGTQTSKVKTEAKCFDAELCSFRDLVNTENNPTPLADALERLVPLAEGTDFSWPRQSEWGSGYGGALTFSFQLILWYHNWNKADTKTHVSTNVSFLQKKGCAYIYQPTLPTTSLAISPLQSFRPMFDMDPRSFHTFKLAWQHFLDFGSSDFRIIVGEQLERWTQRFQAVIKKPLNAVYWLMLMVGSFYRETLVKRAVLPSREDTCEGVPVICVESFVALSAVLFCPERQLLYAGTDPTPSYLQWLQHIADQSSRRKEPDARSTPGTVFEMNEFPDLSVIIVFYGRIQQKVKESMPFSWVGNPTLIKNYIAKYAEDNHCGHQLEQAVRLYSYSCALGEKRVLGGDRPESSWQCWNGLSVCEIGVPMPCTQATFLSPFVTTRPVHMMCERHGAGAQQKDEEKKRRGHSSERSGAEGNFQRQDSLGQPASLGTGSRAPMSRSSSVGSMTEMARWDSENVDDSSDEVSLDTSVDSALRLDGADRSGGFKTERSEGRFCSCARYLGTSDLGQRGKSKQFRYGGRPENDGKAEGQFSMKALGDFDVMHCFAAVLAAGLNLSKQIIRLHFSIDPTAFANLPAPAKSTWADAMLPWYREFQRGDLHGRTRYGILLEGVLRGLFGDGYLSGLHDEVLDILRVTQDTEQETADTGGPQPAQRSSEGSPAPSRKVTITNPQQLGPLRALAGSASPSRTRGGTSVVGQGTRAEHRGTLSALSAAADAVKSKPQLKGVIRDIILWTDLYETESIHTHKSHFESFTQWCHSAQVVPLLQRCYRRCGIAGLLPWERTTGHSKMDPSYPLVLPTVPNLCYGHCYPLYRVQSYFYGGMQTIVCSCDDPHSVEAMRAALKRAPGQDRLNNQYWFTTMAPTAAERHPREAELNHQLLEKLESYGSTGGSNGRRPSISEDGSKSLAMGRMTAQAKRASQTLAQQAFRRPVRAGSGRQNGRKRTLTQVPAFASPRRSRAREFRAGALMPEDAFFWFCQHNFGLFTYPVPDIPRGMLNDGSQLVQCYSDFVSRSGTPEHSRASSPSDEAESRSLSQPGPVPPSICLVQPTEISSHVRHRWEVEKEFADDCALILGDKGWMPGALGHRFTFEAKADNVSAFCGLTEVPQAQLLYVEHASRKHLREAKAKAGVAGEWSRNHVDPYEYLWDSSESEAEREHGGEQRRSNKPQGFAAMVTPRKPARRMRPEDIVLGGRHPADGAIASASLMLPPLIHFK
mmetsp:Transcript_28785/g.66925  ORF Transcript_28785/g.66925 Transcript_28785/m.66925 type:complete len:1261 (+) Transcript_28785:76-3858(+)